MTAPKFANLQDFSMTAILKLRESTITKVVLLLDKMRPKL